MQLSSFFRSKKRPETTQMAVPPQYSKYSNYPSNGLDPRKLAAIFREADSGDAARQMELFEEMEEKDPHIFSQLQTRKNAVTGLDFEMIPYSDDPHDKAVAEFVSNQIKGLKNFDSIQMDLLDAIGKGVALSEILWDYDGGNVVVRDILHIHQKLLMWDAEDTLKVITASEPLGISLVPNKFVLHQYKARSGHPSRAGVLRVCAWMYLFKNYTVKDWVAFAEVYGMPLRLGSYDASASEEDKRRLMEALIRLGSDAAGMIPSTAKITFVEAAKQSSAAVYESLARYCDEQTSKAIVGQTLTADSGGSEAQSRTHDEVRHDLTVADCKALAATLKNDLIRPLVLYNFGHEDRLPTLHYACELPDDLAALKDIFVALTGIGVPIPLPHVYSKFGIPAPQAEEEVTRPPTAMLAPMKQSCLIANKSDDELAALRSRSNQYQAQADALAQYGAGHSNLTRFPEPLLQLLDSSESLEAVAGQLGSTDKVYQLLDDMTDPEAEKQLATILLAANLTGRTREHG